MKKILGLDLGIASIGWGMVNKSENTNEQFSIDGLGDRIISYDNFVNSENGKESRYPVKDFSGGKGISCNAGRTLKRNMRRNLQRYKLRRNNLIEILMENGIIDEGTIFSENGNRTTFETYRLRAKAATEEITLTELARVLLQINKKRGYKSSRKAKSTEEGQLIDGMEIAKRLYNENLTPGQLCYQILNNGKKYLPDFYRSDLQAEFDRILDFQKQFYPNQISDSLKEELRGKNKSQSWEICAKPFGLVGIKRTTKGLDLKLENYKWRSDALSQQLGLEELAIVLQEVNGQINNASGYLGDISDRSKELYFNNQTVGQYQMAQLEKDPNHSLKNQVFYRQDYLNEFETIWETQAKYHRELTPELKKDIRDVVIFYQRPIKSQKGLVSFCEFESRQIEVEIDGKKKMKTIGSRVCPKSSPLFQEFKIWQILNNIQVMGKVVSAHGKRLLYQEEKEKLFAELNYKEKLSKNDALELLFGNSKGLDLNFKQIDGNHTQAELFKAYQNIIELNGHGEHDFSKLPADKTLEIVSAVFDKMGINTGILFFDSSLEGQSLEEQPMYKLWHLLYSFEGDNSNLGNEKLVERIRETYGFDKESATILANVVFRDAGNYGSLSAKAIRKILPHLKDGLEYSVACEYAGYRHSKNSLTKEEIANKTLKDKLELLPRNILRNPVVEKILNQMVNVVNEIVTKYGKPDKIRVELARELKKSAKEREEMTKRNDETNRLHEKYVKILQGEPFFLKYVSRNDVTRYELYLELENNDFKTLYSNTYIPKEKLFSKEFNIEHIIPKAKLFDDSFSNKTIEVSRVNSEKGESTAFDFVANKYGDSALQDYVNRVERMYHNKKISKTKRDKLLMKEVDIPSGFINRDLCDTQYITKKAVEMLKEIVPVVEITTGSVTNRLRNDWQLVNVMQELNWNKYDKLGMTYYEQDHDGRQIPKIKDWTKRNDHRHHAVDALIIACTEPNHIQYLNNLNARVQKGVDEYFDIDTVELSDLNKEERSAAMRSIEQKELYRDSEGKLRFKPPMPLNEFRNEVKRYLESTLVSIKPKNKVVTQNVNISKKMLGVNKKVQPTPRGPLHKDSFYGRINQYATKEEKVNASFDENKILTVSDKRYRNALLLRLQQYDLDPKKAFTGKNSLKKNPVWLDEYHKDKVPEKVNTTFFKPIYTIRKNVSPKLNLNDVVNIKVKNLLEKRLEEYNGDANKAFSDLDKNPIWFKKEKGIAIKKVTVKCNISDAESLHYKRDKDGKLILDENGQRQPVDFVVTYNNHHVAIYRKPKIDKNGIPVVDENGSLQYELDENVVSFYKATGRKIKNLPVIDKEYKKNEGWEFLFTMKKNEYFVFPRYDEHGDMIFNPMDYDEEWYKNKDNYAVISPNLFRVQKISNKNYTFRHHLESVADAFPEQLRDITWKRIQTPSNLNGIVKVRINHIGQIVSVGEY